MAVLTDLPNELLLQICDEWGDVDGGQLTLTRVSRVSRRLSAVAQEVLFRRPYVGAQVFFFRLIRTLLRNSNFCSKVRSLEIYLPDLCPYGSSHRTSWLKHERNLPVIRRTRLLGKKHW
jgi:hypothetical protein